ncbi:MAG TPA: hypothetical protein PKE00_15155, partial [Planctomycetota bacterium]|nr:hypothetical protein [Planctomycetota bacterium]
MAAAFCNLTLIAPAQQLRVVPPSAAVREGNTLYNAPFHLAQCRLQQITKGDLVATRPSALLRGLAMRREADGATGSYAIPARSIPRVTLTLAVAATTIASMSQDFAANIKSGATIVYDGKTDLPFQPAVPKPAPFNIRFAFTRPYFYNKADGDLLFDIVCTDTVTGYSGYWVDGCETRPYGAFWMLGTSGRLSSGRYPTLSLDTTQSSQQVPGGSLTYAVTGLTAQLPALWWIGFSSRQWGALSLPFDLGPLGAPGNSLRTGLDILGVLPVRASGSTFRGEAVLPLPKDPLLGGSGHYVQAMI